jgi:hypothetical protein
MTREFKFWKPTIGKTYRIQFLEPAPSYGQYWVNNPMTPAQLKAKQLVDAISGSNQTTSWMDIRDTRYANSKPYTMPGTSLPAYRYSYITRKNESQTQEIAQAFEQAARDAGFPIRAKAHETHSMDGRSVYWKVVAFFPIHSFEDRP